MAEPIYITISNTPQQIVHVMDGLIYHHNEQDKRIKDYYTTLETYAQLIRQRFWLCWGGLALGLVFLVLEHIVVFHDALFAFITLFCWVAALATAKILTTMIKPRRNVWDWIPWQAIGLAILGTMFFRANETTSMFAGVVQVAGALAVSAMIMTHHIRIGISTRHRRAADNAPSQQFAPHYYVAREVIYTLRNDVAPKGMMIGHLDLTGAHKAEKLMRQGKNSLGGTVHYYRDEWLSLKSTLYDGSLMRLSLLENVKERLSYTKRSRSGKRKTKPAKFKYSQEIKVRITANPHRYNVVRTATTKPGVTIGAYSITDIQIDGSVLSLKATTQQTTIAPRDVLGVLQYAYSHVQRRDTQ